MKKLHNIYLEITNQCNFHCSFCPHHNRPERYMSQKEFSLILSKIQGKSKNLFFHVMGEPLLHPLLPRFIKEAGEKNFTVTITTNASLLQKCYHELSDLPNFARINISLQSIESIEKPLRGSYLLNIIDASEKLYAVAKEARSDFVLSYRIWTKDKSETTSQIFQTLETAYKIEEGSLSSIFQTKNSMIIHDRVAIHTADTFAWPTAHGNTSISNTSDPSFCLALRAQAGILCDGTVIPCCLDSQGSVQLGNILHDSWENIMGSTRAQQIYKGFTEGMAVEPLCKNCSYRLRFTQ